MNEEYLCEYCAAIDFEYLRNPTADELRRINAGKDVYGQYPFKSDDSEKMYPTWRLGRQDRINQSATTCPFCAAIVSILGASNLRSEKSTLFMQNPVCEARIYWSARLFPPDGSTWDLSGGEEEPRVGSAIFYLRRLSFVWLLLEAGTSLEAGRMFTAPDELPNTIALLDGCLQACNAQSKIFTEQLFDDGSFASHQAVFGGRRRPSVIDMNLPRRWLRECLTNHEDSCSAASENGQDPITNTFRLIHLEDRAIVGFRDANLNDLGYAALSYIWGSSQRLQLRRTNQHTLTLSQSLSGRVSRTIEDAMTFASKMGLSYLWVDALCIVQDDDQDKATQIGNMSTIYKHAIFTIIAGAGRDSEAGLPGLYSPRKAEQYEVLVKPPVDGRETISLMSTLNPQREHWSHYSEDLDWSARGWTLQEKVLSRRALTFTGHQIYWSCRKAHWCEETHLETQLAKTHWYSIQDKEFVLDPKIAHSCVPADPETQIWYQLRRLALNYGQRQLTMEGDAFDAFSAVLVECSKLVREPFIWGLPASARFELGLCWEPFREGLVRRTTFTTLPRTSLKRTVPFPSWSWLGWGGSVSLRVEDRYIEEGIDPQIVCYVLRNSPLRVVRASRIDSDDPNRKQSLQVPKIIRTNSPFAITLDSITSECPELIRDRLLDTPDDQVLIFWSETSMFTTSGPVERVLHSYAGEYRMQHFDILDALGNVVGCTAPCDSAKTSHSGLIEFVLIANNRPVEHPPQKIVLQIERRDGIAYRVNIAEIEERAWDNSSPSRKLIALG